MSKDTTKFVPSSRHTKSDSLFAARLGLSSRNDRARRMNPSIQTIKRVKNNHQAFNLQLEISCLCWETQLIYSAPLVTWSCKATESLTRRCHQVSGYSDRPPYSARFVQLGNGRDLGVFWCLVTRGKVNSLVCLAYSNYYLRPTLDDVPRGMRFVVI